MVRKVIVFFSACMIIAFAALPQAIHAAEVYPEGSISNTYTEYFRDILNDISLCDDDYVFFRSGQYEYSMYVGSLSYSEGDFFGSDLKKYTLVSSSGYNNHLSYSFSEGEDLYLMAEDYFIYSNLAHYPKLIERSDIYAFTLLFTLVIIGICCLVRSFFKFTYRSRG